MERSYVLEINVQERQNKLSLDFAPGKITTISASKLRLLVRSMIMKQFRTKSPSFARHLEFEQR